MSLFDAPIETELGDARSILLAGAGGGFDLFCGLPLYFALRARGKQVHLANLTFSRPDRATGGRSLAPALLEIDADSSGQEAYFPELHLARHLRERQIEAPVYCIDRTGVAPVAEAYRTLATRLALDAIVLVDGGCDSLMRGDEVGLGTPQEDIASLLAAAAIPLARKLLVCVGFGVDTYHGVCHADFLAAVAELSRQDAFLGAFSLTLRSPEVRAYRDAVLDVFARMPTHPSIVSASVVSALDGHFGDYHMTRRTAGGELFINPLMSLAWVFRLDAVAQRILYADAVRETATYSQLTSAIHEFRVKRGLEGKLGTWKELPF